MAQELEGRYSYNLTHHHMEQPFQARCKVYSPQIHTPKSKMEEPCANPKVSKTQLDTQLDRTKCWNSQPSSSVFRPSLKQHRCNCQAPVISLKRCFEVLKAFRTFLLDTFMFSIHCVAAQTLTCELSDHTSVQSGDQSSDHSGCISAVGLFLLKAAGH